MRPLAILILCAGHALAQTDKTPNEAELPLLTKLELQLLADYERALQAEIDSLRKQLAEKVAERRASAVKYACKLVGFKECEIKDGKVRRIAEAR